MVLPLGAPASPSGAPMGMAGRKEGRGIAHVSSLPGDRRRRRRRCRHHHHHDLLLALRPLACLCVQLGSTAIAVRTDEGVVLAVEKRVTSPLLVRLQSPRALPPACLPLRVPACCLAASCAATSAICSHIFCWAVAASPLDLRSLLPKMQEPSSIEKVAEVDEHCGVAMSGLTADARTLIDHGRVETQQHRFTYNEPMPLESLTQVCGVGVRVGVEQCGCGVWRSGVCGDAGWRAAK